jgi:hypothetical protein
VAKYEQGASLVHPRSLRRRLLARPAARAVQQQRTLSLVLSQRGRPCELRLRLIPPPQLVQQASGPYAMPSATARSPRLLAIQ